MDRYFGQNTYCAPGSDTTSQNSPKLRFFSVNFNSDKTFFESEVFFSHCCVLGPDDKLDTTDAEFVDVIHSAGRWVGNDEIQVKKFGYSQIFGKAEYKSQYPAGQFALPKDCWPDILLYRIYYLMT